MKKKGLSTQKLVGMLAASHKKKIRRVVSGRIFWNELTKSLKDFARYWEEYSELKHWETVDSFHAELKVTLPKDPGETKI